MIEIKHKNTSDILFRSDNQTLREAVIEAITEGATLIGADLSGAKLRSVSFRGVDLRGVNLERAYLVGANLRGANLEGVNLKGADLEGVDVEEAKNIKSFQCGEFNRISFAIKWKDYIMFKIGCFWGNTEEAIAKVREKYGTDSDYEKLINLYTDMLNNERKIKLKTDKTKLLKDIEALKEKLASMEEELNKPEEFKHFPSKGDIYYFHTSIGILGNNIATDDNLKINTYKTREEAVKAYNKAVALEKIKRRIVELQGDWKDDKEVKFCIQYDHYERMFMPVCWFIVQPDTTIPFMKNKEIAEAIINEMKDELKLIFDVA